MTDQYGGASGGLRVVRGFHQRWADFDFHPADSEASAGEFYRLAGNRFSSLASECQPIDCAAGALVLFDNRLVHATCESLKSHDTREVVYCAFLPDTPLNQEYQRRQWAAVQANVTPPAFVGSGAPETADRDFELHELDDLQRQMLQAVV